MWGCVSHAPAPKGAWAQLSQILGTSYMRAHSMRNNNQILYGDQTRREANLYTSTTTADARSFSTDLLSLPQGDLPTLKYCYKQKGGGTTGGLLLWPLNAPGYLAGRSPRISSAL